MKSIQHEIHPISARFWESHRTSAAAGAARPRFPFFPELTLWAQFFRASGAAASYCQQFGQLTSNRHNVLMSLWTIDDAKVRFSEFVDAAVNSGPQILTSEGREIAVLVSVETWKQFHPATCPSIKELLLSPEPRFDGVFPERRNLKRRRPLEFN